MESTARHKNKLLSALDDWLELLLRIDRRLENIESLLQQPEVIDKPVVESQIVDQEHQGFNWQNKLLLNIKEVSEILSMSRRTAYNKISQGTFPIKHYKRGRQVLFKTEEVKKYLDDFGEQP